jgi:glycosyltransferase involved in cell wall biosynthesis
MIDRASAVVVANSHYTATAWGADGRAPRVVHPPVDLDRYRPEGDRAAVRRRLGLGDVPVVGVVAQLTPWKGQETAVRALPAIRACHPGARLLLAGEAVFVERATRYDNRAYIASLHRTIDELGLGSCVTFLGQRDDVPDVLRALDVLLVPSWEEPFGLVMIEAMAVGTPVVATNCGGPAEVIRNGENGRLVAPDRPEAWAEAAAELLGDRSRRESIVHAGLETAQKFGRARYVEAFAAIYHHALSEALAGGWRRPRGAAP